MAPEAQAQFVLDPDPRPIIVTCARISRAIAAIAAIAA